jgi:hypothetical protein
LFVYEENYLTNARYSIESNVEEPKTTQDRRSEIMKSKTALFAALSQITGHPSWAEKGLKHPQISDETYGNKSYIYADFEGPVGWRTSRKVARQLEDLGFKAAALRGSTIEIQVAYFKGHHWDE